MYKSILLSDEIDRSYLQSIYNFIEEWQNSSLTIDVFTSGSTGAPKKMTLSKANVKYSAKLTGAFFNFKPGQRLLLNLSADYIAGKLMIVRAIEHQMELVIAPNQANPLKNIPQIPIDFGAFVPYQLQAILKNEQTKQRYAEIKNVIIGGAPLPKGTATEVKTLSNNTYATFGMTETITHFALKNITQGADFYTCLSGFEIDKDERGCLILNENKLTNAKIVTNDLVDVLSKTTFKWKGRADNVVNSAGVKLIPELIEQKLTDIISPNRFYLIGRPSQQFGEELVLYVEGTLADEEQIWQVLKKQLKPFEVPKAIITKPQFEETRTGKLKRRLI